MIYSARRIEYFKAFLLAKTYRGPTMSHTSMILFSLMTMAMLIFMVPNIFALNRGHILRNLALWIAIFLGLALIYQNFGPDSPHPLFTLPDSMVGMRTLTNSKEPVENRQPVSSPKNSTNSNDNDSKDNGAQGFTPPKE